MDFRGCSEAHKPRPLVHDALEPSHLRQPISMRLAGVQLALRRVVLAHGEDLEERKDDMPAVRWGVLVIYHEELACDVRPVDAEPLDVAHLVDRRSEKFGTDASRDV